jgi:hypothetical protein
MHNIPVVYLEELRPLIHDASTKGFRSMLNEILQDPLRGDAVYIDQEISIGHLLIYLAITI